MWLLKKYIIVNKRNKEMLNTVELLPIRQLSTNQSTLGIQTPYHKVRYKRI